MRFPPDIAAMAYEVRSRQREFKDVPEEKRKAVAAAMARMSTADYRAITDQRRTPRSGGYGEHSSSRVS